MARVKAGTVKVAGLSDLRRELKRLENADLLGELKDANHNVAVMVVNRAQGKVSTRMERAAAASLRALRNASSAAVVGGSARVQFFAGAEFGSIRHKQFRPWRGNGSEAGYFLYPAIRELTDDIVGQYSEAIGKLTAKAFPDKG